MITGPVTGRLPLHAGEGEALSTLGFNRFPGDPAEGAWITGRNAVIEIPLGQPRLLRVALDLESLPAHPLLLPQRIEVRWNGRLLETLDLPAGRHPFVVVVEAADQTHGLNRLQLLPSYTIHPEALGLELAGDALALYCHSVRLDLPETPSAVGPRFAQEDLHVPAGTVAVFHLDLAEGAQLNATLRGGGAGAGEALLVAQGREGEEVTLFQAEPGGPGREVTIPLSPDRLGTGFARLSFHTSGDGGEAVWEQVRLETPAGPPPAAAGRAKPPKHIVIILFDTLRADHSGPYGSDVKTPHLDAFATAGTLFTEAFSTSSWTRPAVVSMFSGLRVSAHGVNENDSVLPEGVVWLPELLRDRGFKTLGVVRNGNLSKEWGLDRGFVHLEQYLARNNEILAAYPEPDRQAEHIWDSYIQPFLDGQDPDAPKFIYLHELDPHFAYIPQVEPYKSMYLPPIASNLQVSTRLYMEGAQHLTAEDIAWLHANYKGEISAMDAYLGWMLRRFQEAGFGEDTLYVFLSDHGEQFMEHGELFHVNHVWDELIRIPLIWSMPGVLPQGRRVSAPFSLVDFTPTILDWLGWEVPGGSQGASVLPALLGAGEELRPRAFLAHAKPDIVSVVYGQWRLIRDQEGKLPQYQLYDTAVDPQQKFNLWGTRPVAGHGMLALLRELLARDGEVLEGLEPVTGTISPELQRELEAIGYVGGDAGAAPVE